MSIGFRTHVQIAAMIVACALAPAQAVPSFAGPFTYPLPPASFVMTPLVGDLDGDGRADVLELGLSTQPVAYRLSNPNGSFGPRFATPWTGYSVVFAISDMGDGTPEVLTCVTPPYGPAAIAGSLNGGRTCGQGAPLALAPFNAPLPVPPDTQVHSITIDGTQVIAATVTPPATQPSFQAYQIVPPSAPGAPPTVVAVGAPYALPVGGIPPVAASIRSCDLDGDGVMDAVVRVTYIFQSTSFHFFRTTPAGMVPNTPFPSIVLPFGNYVMEAHDLTDDGRAELLLPTASGLTIYWNQGPVPGGDGGVAFAPVQLPPSASLAPRAFEDIDGDGDVDVIGAAQGGVMFLMNGGPGVLTPSPVIPDPAGNGSIRAGDLDGDGDVDLVVGGFSIRIFLNQTVPSAPTRPGTNDQMTLGTTVTQAGSPPATYSGAPFFDYKETTSGQDLHLHLSAPAFPGAQAWLVVEAVTPTGCPTPPFPARKIYASFVASTNALGPFQLSASGEVGLAFAAPSFATPQNESAICQFVILDPGATNGVYASSEAHEIQF